MTGKIAVVGDHESTLGFKAVGFDVFAVETPEETEATVLDLAARQYGVIYITEQALQPVIHIMSRYKNSRIPAIIPIPGIGGSLGLGLTGVRSSVERAVGADILFKD